MSQPPTSSAGTVKLITAVRIREGGKDQLLEWNGLVTEAMRTAPGFISRETIPPQNEDVKEWVFVNRFDTMEHLHGWRSSAVRKSLFEQVSPWIDGELIELVGDAAAQYQVENSVTEVILEHVVAGKEIAYQAWATRVQKAQAEFSGYQGVYSQPPKLTGAAWMTLMRFASVDDLDRWMNSPVRQELLKEAGDLVAVSYQHRVDISFPGWAPTDASGKSPPNWKVCLIVLLGLYPIVCVEILFLMKMLANLGLKSALAGFIGNAISVTFVGYLTTPYLCRRLEWWLLPAPDAPKSVHWKGGLLVAALYALSIALFWNFM